MALPQDTTIQGQGQPTTQPQGQEVAQNPQAQPIQDNSQPIQDNGQPIQDLPAADTNVGTDTAIQPTDDNEAFIFKNGLMPPLAVFQKMLANPEEYAAKYGVDTLKAVFGSIVGEETFADQLANVAKIINGGAVDNGVQEVNPDAQAGIQGDIAQNDAIQDMGQAQTQPAAQEEGQPAGEDIQAIQNIADEETNKSQGQPQPQGQPQA